MGSGTSKHRKSNSTSTEPSINSNKFPTNQSSISAHSYISSLENSKSKINVSVECILIVYKVIVKCLPSYY